MDSPHRTSPFRYEKPFRIKLWHKAEFPNFGEFASRDRSADGPTPPTGRPRGAACSTRRHPSHWLSVEPQDAFPEVSPFFIAKSLRTRGLDPKTSLRPQIRESIRLTYSQVCHCQGLLKSVSALTNRATYGFFRYRLNSFCNL